VIGASGGSIPSDCASSGAGQNIGTQAAMHANGILGIGTEPQDCGTTCTDRAGAAATYYSCSGTTCTSTSVPVAQQVTNPIVMFARDNNGSILQFPGVSGASAKLDGLLIFGIGTSTNNQVGDAKIFTLDAGGTFTTNLMSTGQSLPASTINSGLNAFFFPDSTLPGCATSGSFFCPPGPTSITSVQVGKNQAQSTINFSVDNADFLFINYPGDAAFSSLGGPNGTGNCSAGVGACRFEWGLPFFYGRRVFTAIDGQSVALDSQAIPPVLAPAPPWFAYTTTFSTH
jgi:hypothetical protein